MASAKFSDQCLEFKLGLARPAGTGKLKLELSTFDEGGEQGNGEFVMARD
jgi:hypothetical protein